ncbi:MAG: hypothetical protein M3082_12385 [Candidatus Dormibacteraeota bacterium]|nr:hypothetical protein [Candidatus Dormibacteraeota bacterium]
MGLLTDFFIASPDEVERLDRRGGPAGLFPTVQAKGFDTVDLAQLYEWLTGETANPVDGEQEGELGETWVVHLSNDFTRAIARMDSERMAQFAEEWLLSADEAAVLLEVSALARRGAGEGRELYVWMSL